MSMDHISRDLIVRIGDLLSTRERARLTCVSKEWQQYLTDSWTAVRFDEVEACSSERREQLAWLDRLAINHPNTLQSLFAQPLKSAVVFDVRVQNFTRLQKLELELPQMSNLLKGRFSIGRVTRRWMKSCISPTLLPRLSSMTSLEVIRINVDNTRLKRADEMEEEDVQTMTLSLDTFAVLPQLRELQVVLDYWSEWVLKLSPQLQVSGFPNLKSLNLESVKSWDTEPMKDLVSRLEALRIVTELPVSQVLDAPRLTQLEFLLSRYFGVTRLPFRTSASLRILGTVRVILPADVTIMSPNIASLWLQPGPEAVTDDLIRSLSNLASLKHLNLGCKIVGPILHPFTCLKGLQSLRIVYLMSPNNYQEIRGVSDGVLHHLTKLKMEPDRPRGSDLCGVTFNAEELAVQLPALQKFCAKLDGIKGRICSSTLEELHISCDCILDDPVIVLGELPRLHTLDLSTMTNFRKEKEMLSHSLAELPMLKEVSLRSAVPTPSIAEVDENTIDTLLEALKAATELTALKLVIPNSDLALSRVNFPHLNALAVACRAVEFDCSTLPCRDCFLDLHFTKASALTLERFQTCTNMRVTAVGGPKWEYFNAYMRGHHKLREKQIFPFSDHLLSRAKGSDGERFPGFLEDVFFFFLKDM